MKTSAHIEAAYKAVTAVQNNILIIGRGTIMKQFILFVLCAASLFAQDKPAPTYEPSEIQRLKLENAQLKLLVIALQIQPLEQKRQEQYSALLQACEAIRKENKWPENVKCDPATLKFQAEAPKVERAPIPPPPSSPPKPQ